MRIAFINGNPFWGGAEKWHVTAAAFLKSRGHDVHFFASSDEVAGRVINAGVPVTKLGFRADLDIETFFRLYQVFRRIKPHAVVLNSERDLRLGGAAAKLTGVKVRIHRKGITGVKNNPRYRWTYRYLRSHTLCVAGAVRDEIAELGWVKPDSLRVIHSGVDIEKFKPDGSRNLRNRLGFDEGDILIGAVARLSSIKGFGYLVEAMPAILAVHPTVKCVFAGVGRVKDELQFRASQMGLGHKIKFAGFQDDAADAIRSLDIVAHPSLHTEGLPNSLLEAMACGVPVVATPVAGIPEAVVDGVTGILVPPRDPSQIANALISLIGDRERMRQMGLAGRKRAEEHFNYLDKMAQFETWLTEIVT